MAEDFRVQRRKGMIAIAASVVVLVGLWFLLAKAVPPLARLDSFEARMMFTLKGLAAAVLFTLVLGVEAVAHERLSSPAFDPLSGFETRRLRVNKQYLQNTLEQTVVLAATVLGLAAFAKGGADMREVAATLVVWVLGRWAFWIGYHRSAAMRGLGAAGMALIMVLLVIVAARFGGELAGPIGAAAPVVLFLAIEALLFLKTRPVEPGL